MSGIERNSYCLSCPDIEQYLNREGETGYRCRARGGKYLNLKRQKKTVLRDCPRRKAKYGHPISAEYFDCVWCGVRRHRDEAIQLKGETRRYCSRKCLKEYLRLKDYDHRIEEALRRRNEYADLIGG